MKHKKNYEHQIIKVLKNYNLRKADWNSSRNMEYIVPIFLN